MHRSIPTSIALALVLACTSEPAVDDEAGTTTSPSAGDELDDGESSTTLGTSTTDTNDTTDTTGEDDEPSSFVTPTDSYLDSCSCDPFLQDCPEGEKCVPWAMDGGTWDCTKCVPVLGDHAAGEACVSQGMLAGTDDCDGSSWCFSVAEGTCRDFCMGTADDPECPPGSLCWMSNQGNINACVPACNPLLQDCEQGMGCYWSGAIFGCVETAQANLGLGEPCDERYDCMPGLQCTDAALLPSCVGDNCCSPLCEFGADDGICDVLPGTACVSFFTEGEPPPGLENAGLCALP